MRTTVYLSVIAGIMPIKLLVTTIRNMLTKSDYTFAIDDMCDIGIAACTLTQLYLYLSWSHDVPVDISNLPAEVVEDPWALYAHTAVINQMMDLST